MSLFDKASLVVTPNGVKEGKLYSIKPTDGSGDLDVVRATTATRVNSDGIIESVAANVPRLDYTNGSCPSILVEPQRTNLWINSEDFNTGTLNSSLITYTANSETSPSGTLTADKFEVTTSGGDAFRRFTRTIAIQNFTLSLYVKGNAGQKFQLFLSRDSFTELKDIDVTLSGEWQRIVLSDSFSTTSSTVVMGAEFGFTSDDSVAGQVYYLWGAQLEAGSYATSYIPTVSSAVTRNQDLINNAGDASTFNDSEGVLFAEISALDSESTNKMITISNGSNSTRVLIRYVGTTLLTQLRISGANQYEFSYEPTNIKDNFKIAIKYKANDFSFFVNGFELDSSNSGSTFSDGTLTELAFDDGSGANPFYGNVKQIQYFPTALTDAELAQLTTI